ncbi:aspartate aminotransferase family protein [Pseudomonas typographi]|nr:aspartate aminotransferase family protein [Pseudomonas typographi]
MSEIDYNRCSREQLVEWDRLHHMHAVTSLQHQHLHGPSLMLSRAQGIYFYDCNGTRYIDGLSGQWNVHLGHGRKELAETAAEQILTLTYGSTLSGMANAPAAMLAKKLSTLTPGDLNVSFFVSGGSEANETAFKLARFYWKTKGQPNRTDIICIQNGYHGLTIAASAATGIRAYNTMTEANAPGFYHATGYLTECEKGDRTHPDYASSIRGMIEKLGEQQVAAVILEPIQGAGGVHICPDDYLPAVRRLCDEFGILLIIDEVVTGFGRTGKMFAVEHWGVVPDILTVAKGISSGYVPMGAAILRDALLKEMLEQGADFLPHGFTASGHPVACAVAMRNIELIEQERRPQYAAAMESTLLKEMSALASKHPMVTTFRARGLIGAIEVSTQGLMQPQPTDDNDLAARIYGACLARGLRIRSLTNPDGRQIIAMAPPLIITAAQLNEMFEILSAALSDVIARP